MYKILLVGDHIFCNQIRCSHGKSQKNGSLYYDETNHLVDAMQRIKKFTYDIIILNDGIDENKEQIFLKKCKEIHIYSCIIVIGNTINYIKLRQAVTLGVFDYILNSNKSIDLSETITRCIDYIDTIRENNNLQYIKESIRISVINADTEAFEDGFSMLSKYISEHNLQEISTAGTIILDIAKKMYFVAIEQKQWLSKFIISYQYFQEKMFLYNDLQSMLCSFEKFIRELIGVTKMFYPVKKSHLTLQICLYILNHSDEKITLTDVSGACYLNKTYLSHAFKLDMEITFVEYMTLVKVIRATTLMKESNLLIFEIADKLGFEDIEYFGKKFKKIVGITPKAYKNKLQKKDFT